MTYREKRPPPIRTDISNLEKKGVFDERMNNVKTNTSNLTYYIEYLKGLISSTGTGMGRGTRTHENLFHKMFYIAKLEKEVIENSHMLKGCEKRNLTYMIRNNEYVSTRTHPVGYKIQTFAYFYKDSIPAIAKTYIFSKYISTDKQLSIKNAFYNEITFQIYAKTMNEKVGFITPNIYSYGYFFFQDPEDSDILMACYYIIMEYIEGVMVRNVTYNINTYKNLYERLEDIDQKLKGELLSHNDLHPRNVILTPKNEIAIIDYGEAGIGTNECIGSRLPKMPKFLIPSV